MKIWDRRNFLKAGFAGACAFGIYGCSSGPTFKPKSIDIAAEFDPKTKERKYLSGEKIFDSLKQILAKPKEERLPVVLSCQYKKGNAVTTIYHIVTINSYVKSYEAGGGLVYELDAMPVTNPEDYLDFIKKYQDERDRLGIYGVDVSMNPDNAPAKIKIYNGGINYSLLAIGIFE